MIQKERIRPINNKNVKNRDYVVYWMQASQRTEFNHALEYAISQANELNRPLMVFFGLTDRYREANERHYAFMLEGLREVRHSLENRGIKMVVWHTSPEKGVVRLSEAACLVVVDQGYTKIQKRWRAYAAKHLDCPLIQIETDVIVPVEQASPKEEYSAATLRPRIKRKLPYYLVPVRERKIKEESINLNRDSLDIEDIDQVLARLKIDRSVLRISGLRGGMSEAKRLLDEFIDYKLDRYDDTRNNPTIDGTSNMSPYLHFGQISPLYIALRITERDSPAKDAYLEELIIRRELSMNFVHYNELYDCFSGLPEWCRKTLREHEKDKREYVYSLAELERAKTHDPYWNAAQTEMTTWGKMHGYMRMYWGKKIIEWTKSPEDAYRIALYLNNKYEIDGREPNGYAGVAWCFGKHDRPWVERPIFGKIRYMSAEGLKRKFNVERYVIKVTG